MKKILVTGGAGYIGTHICLLLLDEGFDVVVIDSLVNSSLKILEKVAKKSQNKNFKFRQGDIRSKNFLKEIFTKENKTGIPVEGVIHLAGLKYIAESFENPFLYWDINVRGSINLLEVMQIHNCFKIVFSSSATIYHTKENCKLEEANLLKPSSPYGFTKLAVENFLNSLYLSNSQKWGIINLRYFNPIGAHPSGLIGEYSVGESENIFPIVNKVALRKISKLKIFGRDWSTIDGTPVRDYVHIMDLAKGHIKAIDFLENNPTNFLRINLGSGSGKSVLELIHTFQEVNKISIPYSFSGRRKGDPGYLVANINLAKCLLNWSPQYSFEEMCESEWNWELIKKNSF